MIGKSEKEITVSVEIIGYFYLFQYVGVGVTCPFFPLYLLFCMILPSNTYSFSERKYAIDDDAGYSENIQRSGPTLGHEIGLAIKLLSGLLGARKILLYH